MRGVGSSCPAGRSVADADHRGSRARAPPRRRARLHRRRRRRGEAERVAELEARVEALDASVEALADENAELRRELEALRQARAEPAPADDGDTAERLDDLDARLRDLEAAASEFASFVEEVEGWSKDDDKASDADDGTALARTVELVEASGGVVHYVDHAGRGDRTVLMTPRRFVEGETPLIVSLHGFGGDSGWQSAYFPLHERVESDGFALLLPNGTRGADGARFWNPTDECCEGGKSGEDDVAYLTELVEEARKIADFGAVYVFGYSNGGFMSHHMACKGMPGLRAVASLAGTSYVDESSCEGAPPVSVLHIHGTDDDVIRFDGDRGEDGEGEPAFYVGAREMAARWSRHAGCEWPDDAEPYAVLDLDASVPGAETRAYRVEAGCAEGVVVELWEGVGSGHGPDYGAAFLDALLGWLLARE